MLQENKDKRFAIFLFTVGILTILIIGWIGRDYYFLSLEDKYKSPMHEIFKPSGLFGHALGFIGAALMILNFMYSWRKRYEFQERFGNLKNWLEFHMFVGLLGPTLILYHSIFRFHGIIAIVSFFSMVLVVISGIIGRYIYIQIPRNIAGLELSGAELEKEYSEISSTLEAKLQNNKELSNLCSQYCSDKINRNQKNFKLLIELLKNDIHNKKKVDRLKKLLTTKGYSDDSLKDIVELVSKKIIINRQILLWEGTHKLLDSWRFIHKKLSWVLFITLAVHLIVTLVFGFTWVF